MHRLWTSDGSFKAIVHNVGRNPAGVSIDNQGFPWATCISSDEAIKIDPVRSVLQVADVLCLWAPA